MIHVCSSSIVVVHPHSLTGHPSIAQDKLERAKSDGKT